MEDHEFNILTDAGVNNLVYAILHQACRDYYAMCYGKENTHAKEKITRFFNSDWYKLMCTIPAQVLMDEIEYRAKHNIRLFRIGGEELK